MLSFTIDPLMKFAEIIKIKFQHLPSERSILNGAYKITGNETPEELQILALKCILALKEEYEKRNNISILMDEQLCEFTKLYNVLPTTLKDNVKNQLFDLFGDKILKYLRG